MKLAFVDHFDYPREVVFSVFRDRLLEYTKYVPNLVSVKILEKKKIDEHKIKIRAEWMGCGQIPLVVRAILKPEMIKWKDECIWDEKNWTNTWKIEPYYFKEFVKCKGCWFFQKDGKNKTKVELDGIFEVYIPHFPGVPDKVAQGAGKIIEKFIGKYLEPNLKENNKAIRKLLKEIYSK